MFNNCYDHAGNYIQSQTVQYHISHVPFHIKMNTIKLIQYENQLITIVILKEKLFVSYGELQPKYQCIFIKFPLSLVINFGFLLIAK